MARSILRPISLRHIRVATCTSAANTCSFAKCRASRLQALCGGVPPPQPHPQEHHIALCLVAYLIVERERVDQRLTWRKLERRLILKGPQTSLPSLERLRMAA